jgi:hypothetical protein
MQSFGVAALGVLFGALLIAQNPTPDTMILNDTSLGVVRCRPAAHDGKRVPIRCGSLS